MRARRLHLLLSLAALILSSCSSGSSHRLGRMYASLEADVRNRPPGTLPDPALEERHARRAAEVREMVEKGEVRSARDHLQAAVLLVETDDPKNLELAERLAMTAGEKGEIRGKRVAAEAVDKRLVIHRMAQRYGTQYEWVPALRAWRHYPIDPRTTDAERLAMGVPPLSEIYAGEERLNAGAK